jgi:hypothetical protein
MKTHRLIRGWAFATAIALLGVTAAVSSGAPPPIGDPSVPQPANDPFYTPPADLASFTPGTILRAREVTAPGVDNAAAAYQLLYRTTGARGEPISTVTTVFVPKKPAPGARNVLSFHPASDSLSMKCSPSYTLRSGTGQAGPGLGNVGAWSDVNSFLDFGWVVAVPDYEGPDSQWGAGPIAGYTALDGLRAAERFAPIGLDGPRTKIAMAGYSGGSIPTTWGAALAPTYAPELNIVAAASGGNVPNLIAALPPLDGSPLFGTVIGVAVGVDRAYPDLRLDELLNEKGRALAARDAVDADGCGGSVTNAPFGRIAEYSNHPNAQAVISLPHVRRVFARLNLIGRAAPAAPSFLLNAAQDELTPAGPVAELVAADCAQGATIEFQTPPGDHITGSAGFGSPAVAFIEDRFAGKPAPSVCPPRAGRAPDTRLARVTIDAKRRMATFRSRTDLRPATFQCELSRHPMGAFKRCRSTRTYKRLKPGEYTFAVRAVGPGGADLTPAVRRFRIPG